jgi:adenylosuccinate lyase
LAAIGKYSAKLNQLNTDFEAELQAYGPSHSDDTNQQYNAGLMALLNKYLALIATEYQKINQEISNLYPNGEPKECVNEHKKETLRDYVQTQNSMVQSVYSKFKF